MLYFVVLILEVSLLGLARIKKKTRFGRVVSGVQKWNTHRKKSGGFTGLVKGTSKKRQVVSKAHRDPSGKIIYYKREAVYSRPAGWSRRQRIYHKTTRTTRKKGQKWRQGWNTTWERERARRAETRRRDKYEAKRLARAKGDKWERRWGRS